MSKSAQNLFGTAFVVAIIAPLIQAPSAGQTPVSFSDNDFGSGWMSMEVRCDGSFCSFSAERLSSGGNPGAFRQVTESFDELIIVSHWNDRFTYDPRTEGAISALDYSFDLLRVSALGTANWPLLVQDGNHYITGTSESNINDSNWTNHARSGLDPSAFVRIFGPGPARPDFSPSGAPLSFGYATSNTSTGPTLTTLSGIDNWSVTIIPLGVPSCRIEPRNTFLPFHLTHVHLIDPNRFPHLVRVEVSSNGSPPPNPVEVSVSASRPILSGPSGTSTSTAISETDARGQAIFEFSPVNSERLERTDFVASGAVEDTPFTCAGSVVVGTRTFLTETATAKESPLAWLPRFRDLVLGRTKSGDDDAGGHRRLFREVVEIVRADPALLRQAWQVLRRYTPLVEVIIRGEEAILTNSDLLDADTLLTLIESPASPELRSAISRLREHFGNSYAWKAVGVTVQESSAIAQQTEQVHRENLQPARTGTDATVQASYGRFPLSFEPNQGQVAETVHYLARGPGYNLYLMPQAAVVLNHSLAERRPSSGGVLRMEFVASHPTPTVTGLDRLPGRSHYVIGSDPGRWRTNVPHYAKVKYEQIYPGVDLVYYGNHGELEWDFMIAPGADPGQILFAFQGVARLEISEQGSLLLHNLAGRRELKKPFIYQEIDGSRHQISGRYVLKESHQVGFQVAAYDESRLLLIDPVLSYSSYLGGAGDDGIKAVAVDSTGNAYVTGTTSSADLPVEGMMEPGFRGGGFFNANVFVAKLNSSGSALAYSTYFGGSDDEVGLGIAVDSEGNAYVTGATRSADFSTTQAIQAGFGGGGIVLGTDAFVMKLNPTGSPVYSTYLGGSDDDGGAAIALDSQGNAYVAGVTASADFPVQNALQPANGGGRPLGSDAFVVKVNAAGTKIVYASYLGGTGDDHANGIAVDASQNIYLTGLTYSADFPTLNPFQQDNGGSADAFVTKFNAAGSALIFSTYLGGNSDNFGLGIALNAEGHPHVTGLTGSSDFPLMNAAQPMLGSDDLLGFDAFVTKLNAVGSGLLYSTYLGGANTDLGFSIAVDSEGGTYVAGTTDSSDFPTESAIQEASGGSNDAFVVKLEPSGSTLAYSSYLGGSGDDAAPAIAVDASGSAYVAGGSYSTNSPITFGAFQTSSGGSVDAWIAKIIAGSPLPAVTTVSAASFSAALGMAPESIGSGFGEGLAAATAVAQTVPLPTSLAGTVVRITDSEGTEHLAQLFFVAPGQINYLIPEDAAPGLALVIVEIDGQEVARGTLRINDVAPSLFAANANGQGVAAAVALRVAADDTQTSRLIFDGTAPEGSRAALPIDLGPEGDRIFLLMFGTGMRGFATEATATVGGEQVGVGGPVVQPEFLGLDQANLGPLPRSLIGRGEVDIVLTVDGKTANTVTVSIQ